MSGSWDATVKVWSVGVGVEGETVSVNREALVELYDAESSIVSVDAMEWGFVGDKMEGVVIVAGCADGSFVVWWCADGVGAMEMRGGGGVEVLHKEMAMGRGVKGGPCGVVKWDKRRRGTEEELVLFAGFGGGRIVSYVVEQDKGLRSISKLHLGSPIKCFTITQNTALVGCADGGLRAVTIHQNNISQHHHFDNAPRLWKAVHGGSCPGISCIGVARGVNQKKEEVLIIATGAEDGTVVISELKDAI